MPLVFLFIFCCIVPLSADELPLYIPSDNFAFDCSPSYPSSDFKSTFASEKSFSFSSVSRTYALDPHYRDGEPKISACVFRKQNTYPFSVSTGPKFVRLYFKPMAYPGLMLSKALFSVSIDRYRVLTTSEGSYSKLPSDVSYFVRELCINVDSQILNVTFTPSSKISGSYAFFNKIEIVSMPSNLYIREDAPLPLIGQPSSYVMDNSTALELMYRINIGGELIPQPEDTGMFRLWTSDADYFVSDEAETSIIQSDVEIKSSSLGPAFAAPVQVYASARTVQGGSASNYSSRWSFPVDFGFYYLVRLHFCEISRRIQSEGQRVFRVYISNQSAEEHADIFHWSHGAGIPIFRDYIVNFSRPGDGIKYLSIATASDYGSYEGEGPILNGLEIFKLSDHFNNLAGNYPFGVRNSHLNVSDSKDHSSDDRVFTGVAYVLGWSVLVMNILFCFSLVVSNFKGHREKLKQGQSSNNCRIFSVAEIKSATNNFADTLLIGTGGFGMVYKGTIDGGTINVAIKRANPSSHQGFKEFQTEISMLSELRHSHLVSLIGYSMEDKEMILVYDYMARGTLRDHLYKSQKPPLPWKQRLKICIGAARGLHYLHTGAKGVIIHRDIKSTNILLDDKWVAKVSDFGLSKAGSSSLTQSKTKTHVSTMVKGTFGYLDPEYYRRQKLTEKSDVYSFGVVLFEILCARPAVLPMGEIEEEEEYEKASLAEWALHCCQMGTIEREIDPYLEGKIDPECFRIFTDIAKKCLAEKGIERPSMGDVLCNLELAMQKQNAADLLVEMGTKEAKMKLNGEACIEIEEGQCISSYNSN
ncbi:receptor-like protein kinase FERONIA [Manihot esculenta]|uniref:Uncharacterized protein n=2 Tax=Manihot esculenta TaxID=3983 RepID=A0ACB7HE90_MANES|nr:receptor-like protein kinase FERONIA [Manihot esculenta]KAG8650481.1 hypothetical protein MANES_07G046400v8 [Manihot esculenta]